MVLLAVVGVPWTLIIVPLLAGSVRYPAALISLAVIAALGVGWELVYHVGQQLRWDKDWPSLFALASGVPEGALAYPVLRAFGLAPRSVLGYVLYFGSTWLMIWLVMQGPLRVLAPRWRHAGGRVLPHRPRIADRPRAVGAHPVRRLALNAAYAAMVLVTMIPFTVSSEPAELSGSPAAEWPGNSPDPTGTPDGGIGRRDPARVEPVEITVPKLGVSSTLIPLGLAEDGTLQTPSVGTPMQAGWYALGPAPGEVGPAVVVGHVDGLRQPGIFFRLHDLVPGDEIDIRRADGSSLRFFVRRIRQAPKDRFPTEEVYGPTTGPELRLITCTGSFDRAAKSYRDNLIVFAGPRDTPEHG
jgi:hypothetical protein